MHRDEQRLGLRDGRQRVSLGGRGIAGRVRVGRGATNARRVGCTRRDGSLLVGASGLLVCVQRVPEECDVAVARHEQRENLGGVEGLQIFKLRVVEEIEVTVVVSLGT